MADETEWPSSGPIIPLTPLDLAEAALIELEEIELDIDQLNKEARYALAHVQREVKHLIELLEPDMNFMERGHTDEGSDEEGG